MTGSSVNREIRAQGFHFAAHFALHSGRFAAIGRYSFKNFGNPIADFLELSNTKSRVLCQPVCQAARPM